MQETNAIFQSIRKCRVCMSGLGDSDYNCFGDNADHIKHTSIYEYPSEKYEITIAQLLMTTTPQLVIRPNDKLPQIICIGCLQKLISLYDFQQMCIRSDSKFRRLLSHSGLDWKSLESVEDPLHSNEIIKIELSDESQQSIRQHDNLQNEFINIKETIVDSTKKEANKDARKIKRLYDVVEVHGDSEVDNCRKKQKYTKRPNAGIDETVPNTSCSTEANHNAKYQSDTSKSISITNPDDYQCNVCLRRFAKATSLIAHRRCHKLTKMKSMTVRRQTQPDVQSRYDDYECKLCGKHFNARRTLLHHNRSVHKQRDDRPLKYFCEYCNERFHNSVNLKEHLKTHADERQFLCPECGRFLKSSSGLQQHMLRHSELKIYECPNCPKKFSCNSDLSSHKIIHRKEKPHICETCGSSFATSYTLKVHKRNHSGERPHKCDYCDMRFVRADQKRRHERIHTGEKPYKCKYCDRAYAQSNDLIKHLRVHLGEKVYKCELCPQAFRLVCELRKHFAEHKNDDDETRQRNLKALMEEQHHTNKQHSSAD